MAPSLTRSYGVNVLHVVSAPVAVRSIWLFWLLSCQATTRTRWLRVDESTVTVIDPFAGMAWLMRTPAGGVEMPLMAVNNVDPAPMPSAFLSWFLSQKPKV